METFAEILRGAVAAGASDIHLKPGAPVVFRIQREICPVEAPPPSDEWLGRIITAIAPPHLQQRLQSDREVDFAYHPEGIGRFRVNVYQQRGHFVMALRVVRMKIRDFAELHLPAIVKKVAETTRGIVLITGAPGSGKSSTLAAILEHVNTRVRKHIVTLED